MTLGILLLGLDGMAWAQDYRTVRKELEAAFSQLADAGDSKEVEASQGRIQTWISEWEKHPTEMGDQALLLIGRKYLSSEKDPEIQRSAASLLLSTLKRHPWARNDLLAFAETEIPSKPFLGQLLKADLPNAEMLERSLQILLRRPDYAVDLAMALFDNNGRTWKSVFLERRDLLARVLDTRNLERAFENWISLHSLIPSEISTEELFNTPAFFNAWLREGRAIPELRSRAETLVNSASLEDLPALAKDPRTYVSQLAIPRLLSLHLTEAIQRDLPNGLVQDLFWRWNEVEEDSDFSSIPGTFFILGRLSTQSDIAAITKKGWNQGCATPFVRNFFRFLGRTDASKPLPEVTHQWILRQMKNCPCPKIHPLLDSYFAYTSPDEPTQSGLAKQIAAIIESRTALSEDNPLALDLEWSLPINILLGAAGSTNCEKILLCSTCSINARLLALFHYGKYHLIEPYFDEFERLFHALIEEKKGNDTDWIYKTKDFFEVLSESPSERRRMEEVLLHELQTQDEKGIYWLLISLSSSPLYSSDLINQLLRLIQPIGGPVPIWLVLNTVRNLLERPDKFDEATFYAAFDQIHNVVVATKELHFVKQERYWALIMSRATEEKVVAYLGNTSGWKPKEMERFVRATLYVLKKLNLEPPPALLQY